MDFLRTLKNRKPKRRAKVSSTPLSGGRSKPFGIHIIRKYLREKAAKKITEAG
jgi:hypothetical protein